MARNKLYFLLLIIGVSAGLSWGIVKARATTPEGETSVKGEQPASVYYDETWNATEALVSSDKGYISFLPSVNIRTQTAAEFDQTDDTIKIFPKFVVREWTVHGHIHFE
jgi:hypothetical protein